MFIHDADWKIAAKFLKFCLHFKSKRGKKNNKNVLSTNMEMSWQNTKRMEAAKRRKNAKLLIKWNELEKCQEKWRRASKKIGVKVLSINLVNQNNKKVTH
jgi:hypothetical protein